MTHTLPERDTEGHPLVIDLYARLSCCPADGSTEKVETQLADCRALVEARNGWVIGREHADPNMSAWKRGRKRKGWDALLQRISNGEIDGVVVWHTDRLFRQPADLEELINLADVHRLRLGSAHGEHDLADSDHRLALRINAATQCKSSDDTSRRLKRRFARMREAGRVQGRARSFGYPGGDRTARKRKDGTLPPVAAEQVERERAELREATADVLAGLPVSGIARQWNADRLATATGGQWSAPKVRAVLLRASNAGIIEHDGKEVARAEGKPIIDPDDFARLRAVFGSRRRGRVPGERYLASGIVVCGCCGKALAGHPHAGTYRDTGERRRQYHCPPARNGCGGVAADARRLDEFLREWTLRQLSDPAHSARVAARLSQNAQRAAEVADQIATARATETAIMDRLGRGEISLDEWESFRRPFAARMATLSAERDALAVAETEQAGPVVAEDRAELARQWGEGTVAERRALLVSALAGHRARLLPANGARSWNPERVEILPLESPLSE